MSKSLREGLPEALKHLQVKPLFLMRLSVSPPAVPGQTPNGFRRVGVIQGGSFEGERLSGEVLAGGNDWQTIRSDRCIKLDVRLVLRTDDNALIGMTYQALRSGPAEVMERLDKGEVVDPASYYFRMTALFETGAPKYDWINRIIAVGTGGRLAAGPIYSLFEVL
jgi:Protein of unknown function (DUF3237)